MKVIEILRLNRSLFEMLHEYGIKADDIQHLGLFDEYEKMRVSGEKTTYIVASLSEKYNLCERKVCKILKRFKKDCQIGAV